MARKHAHVLPPGNDREPGFAPREIDKQEFGRRLTLLIRQKGWSQSEFARRVTDMMPGSKEFSRANVTNYTRGRSYPGPDNLDAMARTLGLSVGDLLPNALADALERADDTLIIRQVPGTAGRAWLRVNQQVSLDQAKRIMDILSES